MEPITIISAVVFLAACLGNGDSSKMLHCIAGIAAWPLLLAALNTFFSTCFWPAYYFCTESTNLLALALRGDNTVWSGAVFVFFALEIVLPKGWTPSTRLLVWIAASQHAARTSTSPPPTSAHQGASDASRSAFFVDLGPPTLKPAPGVRPYPSAYRSARVEWRSLRPAQRSWSPPPSPEQQRAPAPWSVVKPRRVVVFAPAETSSQPAAPPPPAPTPPESVAPVPTVTIRPPSPPLAAREPAVPPTAPQQAPAPISAPPPPQVAVPPVQTSIAGAFSTVGNGSLFPGQLLRSEKPAYRPLVDTWEAPSSVPSGVVAESYPAEAVPVSEPVREVDMVDQEPVAKTSLNPDGKTEDELWDDAAANATTAPASLEIDRVRACIDRWSELTTSWSKLAAVPFSAVMGKVFAYGKQSVHAHDFAPMEQEMRDALAALALDSSDEAEGSLTSDDKALRGNYLQMLQDIIEVLDRGVQSAQSNKTLASCAYLATKVEEAAWNWEILYLS